MNGIHRFSARVIDYAERLSDVADAAQGKNHQRAGATTRWLLLPASGAALYALVKSESFSPGEGRYRRREDPRRRVAR